MESTKFRPLYDKDITDSIRGLIEESSYLKTKLFKSVISGEKLNKDIPKAYKNAVRDFIKIWEDYSNTLSEKIKSSTANIGVYTISYTFAKEYIYSNDDYASVLPFADGVIKGIKSGKFDEADDVEDFFKYTANKAFHDKGDSVAALLDNVINNIELDMINSDTAEVTKYNAVRKYQIFKSTDAKELYKSIDKVVDFLTDEMGDIVREIKSSHTRMFVAMINNIIEYITYSLTAYATRIYLISKYASPYIMNNRVNERYVNTISEATITLSESDIMVTVMHDAPELECRDYNKYNSFMEILDTFCKAVGADPLFGTDKPKAGKYFHRSMLSPDNEFVSKLLGNALYEYLTNSDARFNNYKEFVTEMNHLLKEYIYNSTQAIPGSTTPKQEILHIIRSAKYDDTLSGYQKLTKDMYLASGVILCSIVDIIHSVENWLRGDIGSTYYNTTNINDAKEDIKFLKDLYNELAVSFLHKGRDIEMHINALKQNQLAKLQNDVSIKIPHQKINDLNSNENMMSAIPDTTRIPIDLMDIYDTPTFEALEMYDDYLRSLPGMEDDSYLSEAANLSSIINAIFSRIRSAFNKFINFINDKRFQSARKWVLDHTNDLMSLDFNGKQMYVLPYKADIKLPDGYKNLINKLNDFNKDVVASEESKKSYIKSLYPSETIYNWFYSNETDKSGPEMYRNHILFYKLDETKKEVPAAIPVNGNALHNYVSDWISTMRGAPDVLNEFNRIRSEIENAVNKIKNQMVTIENEAKQKDINNEKENPPSTPASTENNNTEASSSVEVPPTNPSNTNDNKTNNPTTGNEALLMEIQTTIMRLWGALAGIFIQCYLTEYKYLKDAYNLGRQKSN